MNIKYFLFALAVTIVATVGSWASLIGSATGSGSSWSSGARGGWSGGGGHK